MGKSLPKWSLRPAAAEQFSEAGPGQQAKADRSAGDGSWNRRQNPQYGGECQRAASRVVLEMLLDKKSGNEHRRKARRDGDDPNRRDEIENGPQAVHGDEDQG